MAPISRSRKNGLAATFVKINGLPGYALQALHRAHPLCHRIYHRTKGHLIRDGDAQKFCRAIARQFLLHAGSTAPNELKGKIFGH